MTPDLISRFRGCPVLVVGDLMLDEFVWGQVTRVSPEAPVAVVVEDQRTYALGGAANAAANVRSLGGRPILAGVVGDDPSGVRVCGLLASLGIGGGAVAHVPDRPTTTKTRVVAQGQQMLRIDREDPRPLTAALEADLLARARAVVPEVRACVLSDYGKGVVTVTLAEALIAACRSAGVPVVVDPKGVDYAKYRGASVVKPNQTEAGKLLNRDLRSEADMARAGADLLDVLGPQSAVLITRGAQGMTLFVRGRPAVHIPTRVREVYDVTGAGDTVAGTLGLSLAAGVGLADACRLAASAAGIVVGKMGTATCTLDELL